MTSGDATRLFFGLMYVRLQPFFLLYWAVWLATLLVLAFVLLRLRPVIRAKAWQLDLRLRPALHRVRFRSEESAGEAARRERVPLTWFFRFWTNFASAPSLSFWSLAVPLAIYRWQLEQGPHLMSMENVAAAWLLPGLCFGGSMLLSFVLKRVVRRARPPLKKGDFGYKLAKDPSFPSGHSLTSFCFWAMVPVSAALTNSAPPTVALLAACGALTVALTGLSRLYLRVHYLSDVLGGYCIGAVWTLVCLGLLPGRLVH